MNVFDTYGFKSKRIKQIAKELKVILNVQWELHDSSFKGEYYLYKGIGEGARRETISLELNFNEEYGWRESQFTDYRTLLYVSYSERYKEIEDILLNRPSLIAKLLKRTMLD